MYHNSSIGEGHPFAPKKAEQIRLALQCGNAACDCHRASANVHCPAHDDQHPSLTVSDSARGIALMRCHAGCSQEAVIGGLKQKGIWPSSTSAPHPSPKQRGHTVNYDYINENGQLLFQVVRTDTAEGKKNIYQRQPDGNGEWIYKMSGAALTLYCLPEVLSADTVFVVEGEKCADALNAALSKSGVHATATTNPQGAGKWRDDYRDLLSGKHVIVIPDNDEPGKSHALRVCSSVNSVAQSLKLVELPGLKAKGDIADWLAEGRTVAELLDLSDSTQKWTPPNRFNGDAPSALPSHQFALTDFGNAERFVHQHGNDIRYCYDMKKWLTWNGRHWAVDATNEVERRAKHTVRAMRDEAESTADYENRRKLADYAKASESSARIRQLIELAKSESVVATKSTSFDFNPWLLNCNNGTIDLATGKLRGHDRRDLITKMVPVDYDPEAKCPTFTRFVTQIMGGKRGLIRFIQRAIGYALTGSTKEQVLFICYGTGANGKSTLMNIFDELLHDYAKQMPAETLMQRTHSSGGANNDVARLRGARLVSAMETEEARRFAMVLVKQMTGGDTMAARFLYGEYFEFKPEFKIFLITNHKPEIPDTTEASWRRIRLIPFDVTIPENQRDKDLSAKLQAELPGILAWAVRGCLEWQRKGLKVPKEVTEATENYRAEMDRIGDFLAECCEQDPHAKIKASDIYARFHEWCITNRETVLDQKVFSSRLVERGFRKVRKSTGWYYLGLR